MRDLLLYTVAIEERDVTGAAATLDAAGQQSSEQNLGMLAAIFVSYLHAEMKEEVGSHVKGE
jgi:hypothetical protein